MAQPVPRFVVFFGATVLHAVVFMGLYVLLDLRQFGTPYAAVAGQAAATPSSAWWRFSWSSFYREPSSAGRRREPGSGGNIGG